MALQFHENLYFYRLFHEIQAYFLFKRNEENSSNKNHHGVLMLFVLIMWIVFFTAR